jgi:hypothetical protein
VIGRSACFQHFVNARPLVRPVTVVAFSLTGRPELGWDELSELVQWVFEAGSGIVFGHNTAGAGASIPGHAHYHYFQGRVPLTGHAVDTLESGPSTELGLTRDPLPAALYIASGDAAALTHVVWAAINSLEKQGVPYNLCACADGDGLARFWVFPRCGGDEGPGRIAFLELAGIYLLAESATDTTRPEALERLQASVSPRGSAVHRLLLDDACEALYSGRPSFTPRSAAAGRPSRRAWAGTRGTAWARRAQV